MSVKIMSAIFETEFRDLELPPEEGQTRPRMAKASSLKLLLLAIADHANDEGESAYPGLTRLEKKTGLSRQGIIDILSALKYNGLLSVADSPSRLGTNDYTLNLGCFPCLQDASQATLLIKPLDYPSQATLLPLIKPLDHNHPLTVIKPSSKINKKDLKNISLDWFIQAGVSSEELAELSKRENVEKECARVYEVCMGYNPLPWWTDNKLKPLLKFLLTKTGNEIRTFATWARREYSTLTPSKARQYPHLVIECWPQAFTVTPKTKPRAKPVSAES